MKRLRLGTRSSPLALWQAEYVRDMIRRDEPECDVALVHITTQGDKMLTAALAQMPGKGVFVKEIEDALLADRIDAAVHSAKDMPTELPDGLTLTAFSRRADPHDVLLTRKPAAFADLPVNACLGTGSLRRQSQLLAVRPDLQFVEFRGNLETRYQKFLESDAAGLVLAQAGITRLAWTDRPYAPLPYDISLPAPGQGALAIETRADDPVTRRLLERVHDADTAAAVMAERAFLAGLGGGCQAPIAALGTVDGPRLSLVGVVLMPDGSRAVRGRREGPAVQADELGAALAESLIQQGAAEILATLAGEAG